MKVVIIGAGAAGASCAARLRRLREDIEILILEKTNEISIASCGLPYYISDVIDNRENMFVSSAQKFKNWFNIDVEFNCEVVQIHRDKKFIKLKNEKIVNYDKLVLALGAQPALINFENSKNSPLFSLRTLADADKIKEFIKNNNCKTALVIGGGFIGIEMAENLQKMNLKVTLIEAKNQILSQVDEEIALLAKNKMQANNIEIILNDLIEKYENNTVFLKSKKQIKADIIVSASGIIPSVEIAKKAGLEVDFGIKTNEFMQTNDPDIFAAGDSVETKDFIFGKNTLIPLAGPANRQGRIVADNICGYNSTYKNTQAASVIKIFDLTVANVGKNEKQLIKDNIPFWKTYIFSPSHASYYPNAKPTLYKLLFNNEGKIFGAQAAGFEGVEKRIDTISAIIRNHGTVQEMLDCELCYAPSYSSAKDAVNILGMCADNIIKGLIKPAYYEDLKTSYLIDVRSFEVYKKETIENAHNIPVFELRKRLNEVPKNQKVVLFCNSGYTSYVASRILASFGYNNVYSLSGGIELYKIIVNSKVMAKK